MIPRANITAWRNHAPWPSNEQVEQDLILSRALIAMFSHEQVATQALFRGGTALHKLFFAPARRYSEDIDLVQRDAGPIGGLVNAIRETLDPWLGEPKWKQTAVRFSIYYRFVTSFAPVTTMRLMIEINTREHFSVLGTTVHELRIENPWFSGTADLPTYELDELLGTKLRALYQRKKGRDLYDLWLALTGAVIDRDRVIECFQRYLEQEGAAVTRAQFEANLAGKMQDMGFVEDIRVLIPQATSYDPRAAAAAVAAELVARLPGEPWKGLGPSVSVR